MYPWTDRTGRFSLLKSAVFASLFLPLLWLIWRWRTGDLGPLPIHEAILESGLWTVRMIVITLAITPLQRIFGWGRLALIRRQVGLAAMCYALLHFSLYIADQKFNLARVASEIALRIYLTIGFVAVVGLVILGVTSAQAAVRKLGRKWKPLHRAAYGIAALGILHFFMQSKIDATQAALMMGFFILVMLYRIPNAARLRSVGTLVGIAMLAALATAGLEAVWYGVATGVKPLAVLNANLLFPGVVRPAWIVFGTGLAVALVSLGHRAWAAPKRQVREAAA
ncbi:MAG: protein-methionine-sulfoxide reductase heme-binding subunit MsrQ [Hyphomicrobiales bacterium]